MPRYSKGIGGLACLLLLSSCGYHVGGKADLLPKSIQTIAVPAFRNATIRYPLTDSLPQAIAREFIARSRYHVVTQPDNADAVIEGSVTNAYIIPVIFDPLTGKATAVQMNVYLTIALREKETGRILYSRDNFEVRQNYEIALSSSQFFDESSIAVERVSRDVARAVVSGILENF